MEQSGFPLLSLYVFAPVLGMAAVLCIPSKRGDIIKTVASAAAALPLIIGIYLFFTFKDTGTIHYYESHSWLGGLNAFYKLGMDGLSAPMLVLSGLVGFISVVASWGIEKQVKGYFALILLLLAGMNGVFCALDFFLFYVFWELMLLPMYFLIGIWGGPNRVYAAIKFFLYTMAGSVFMLVALLATWYWSDAQYANPDTANLAKGAAYETYEPYVRAVANEKNLYSEKLMATYMVDTAAAQNIKANYPAYKAGLTASDALRESRAKLNEAKAGTDVAAIELAEKDVEAKVAARNTAVSKINLERSFDFIQLKARYHLFLGKFTFLGSEYTFAMIMFVFLYIAFAIKVPVFPFHTWLPWAHVEAPTAISVILAGILLKMGVYGFLRIAFPMFPTAAVNFAVPIALFGVFNILYGACCAMAQDDLKKIVAYSSVSHMGYCMLGLAALTTTGITGSVLQMFNHGTSTSMMFLLVGVIYDRAHHRDVNKFGGLAAQMPLYAGFFTIALFASMGLPGLSGFVSEILVFLGAFNSNLGSGPWAHPRVDFTSLTAISAIGVVLTAAYLLWMMQRVFFGPLNEKYKNYEDMTGREKFTLIPLVIVVIALGVYPKPLIELTQTSCKALRDHVVSSVPELKSSEKLANMEAVAGEKHVEEAKK
jgi:NADH-quinone oxidoreductase subunit M